jgi:hypothetical protein
MKELSSILKTTIVAAALLAGAYAFTPNNNTRYEYKQISAVESIIPGGLGRSRVLTTDENGTMIEKDLKNFYSMVGINFGNISNNDQVIVDRVNEYIDQGWELVHVTSGVQSPTDGGKSGIFITRYIFRRPR